MATSLAGAWRLVDSTENEALIVFTDKHYSLLRNRKEPVHLSDPPTDSELAAAFKNIGARAGTYALSDNKLELEAELTRHPRALEFAKVQTWEVISLEENTLRMQPPYGTEMTFQKVS